MKYFILLIKIIFFIKFINSYQWLNLEKNIDNSN